MHCIIAPPRVRVWSKNGWHVYFDPYNFVWVKVNNDGRKVLDLFCRHWTLDQVVGRVAEDYKLSSEAATETVTNFTQSMVAAGFLHENEYRERSRALFPTLDFPNDIYLHLTNKCNLKCPYCYNKTDRETKIKLERRGLVPPTMSTSKYKELIAKIVAYGVRRIRFTGGEPLLRPDVAELVTYARSLSATVRLEMLTNAIKIDETVAEWMCEYLDRVTISLDGHEQHMHEHYRGKNTFAPTVRGIRTLIQKRNQRKQSSPSVSIVPVLTSLNIRHMPDIFAFSLDDLGADGLSPIIFQAGDHQAVNLSQIPKLDIYLDAADKTSRYMAERARRNGTTLERRTPVQPRKHCGVGHGEISIDPAGFVYPCQSLHYNEFICGNVREDDIRDIFLNSPVMRRVRGTDVDRVGVCSHCDLKYLCHGGCRATAYNIYREFDSHNEIYCKQLETLAVNKLWSARYETTIAN
jgi:radical SAM protein with 4Fe4S-binding SPASM domain